MNMPGNKYRNVDGAGLPIIGRPQQPQQIHVQPIQWLMGGDPEFSPEAVPTFTFDGHEFPRVQPQPTAMFLYLAYKARRGDEAAKMVLDTFTIGLNDAFGKSYWPVAISVEIDAKMVELSGGHITHANGVAVEQPTGREAMEILLP